MNEPLPERVSWCDCAQFVWPRYWLIFRANPSCGASGWCRETRRWWSCTRTARFPTTTSTRMVKTSSWLFRAQTSFKITWRCSKVNFLIIRIFYMTQWRSEYQRKLKFKWSKPVWSLHGRLNKWHLSTRLTQWPSEYPTSLVFKW